METLKCVSAIPPGMEDVFIPHEGEYVTDVNGKVRVGNGKDPFSKLPILRKSSYGTGCLKSPYDSRDYQFSTLVAGSWWSKSKNPIEFIPSYEIEPFDQGDTQMCCACAVAMSRYIGELNDSGIQERFSPAYIYANRANSVVVDGVYEGEGMYLKDALKQLTISGDCAFWMFRSFGTYNELKEFYDGNKGTMDNAAHPYRVSSYYAVKTDNEIKKAILSTGSVLASFIITSGWYDTKEDGIIRTYGNIESGHAVLIIGWKIIDNKQYWIILNSWGKEWGDNGLGYIETTEMMMEAYCIVDDVHEVDMEGA